MFCFEICQLSLTFALTTFCNWKMSIFWLGRNKFTSFAVPLAGTFALILLVHSCFGRSAIPLAGTNAIVFWFPQSWPQVLPLSLPATKPEKSGFLSCAGGFAIPSAAVLSQFGPKSNYLSLNYLDTFNIYIYIHIYIYMYIMCVCVCVKHKRPKTNNIKLTTYIYIYRHIC